MRLIHSSAVAQLGSDNQHHTTWQLGLRDCFQQQQQQQQQ
jgi:hypothetical protein